MQRGDPVVYTWITEGAFKACQDTFMIRVTFCWPSGKLKVDFLNYLYYKKHTLRQAVWKRAANTEV